MLANDVGTRKTFIYLTIVVLAARLQELAASPENGENAIEAVYRTTPINVPINVLN